MRRDHERSRTLTMPLGHDPELAVRVPGVVCMLVALRVSRKAPPSLDLHR